MKVKNLLGWVYAILAVVAIVVMIEHTRSSDNNLLFALVGLILLSITCFIIMLVIRSQRFTEAEAKKWEIPHVYNKMHGWERFFFYHGNIMIASSLILIGIRVIKFL